MAYPHFSPDGRWLSTYIHGGRLFAVDTWELGPKVAPGAGFFSPDSKLLAVPTPAGIQLIDHATGRQIALLEDPNLSLTQQIVFTRDGTTLVALAGYDGVHVWDLRLMRRRLKEMGLDWEWPEFPAEPGDTLPPAATGPAVIHALGAMNLNPPNNPSWYYDLGKDMLRAQGKSTEDRVTVFRKALELYPRSATAYCGLAQALCMKKDWPAAITACTEALKLEPNNNSLWCMRGNVERDAGQLQDAFSDYSRAIKLFPNHHWALLGRARVNASLRQWDRALADYSQALAAHSKSAHARNGLAWFLATCPEPKFRDPKRAVELATQAVAKMPKAGTMWNTLGVSHYRAGDWKAALTALAKSSEIQKENAYDGFFQAMAHWQLGEKEEARKRHDRAVAWMEKNRPSDEELRRFRDEAAQLLGVDDKRH